MKLQEKIDKHGRPYFERIIRDVVSKRATRVICPQGCV